MPQFPRGDAPRLEENVLSTHEGAVSRVVPYLLGEAQVEHTENLLINKVGLRSRRKGVQAFGGRAGVPGGLGWYKDGDGVEYLASVWGNDIQVSAGNGGWAQVASGCSLVQGHLHQFQRVLTDSELGLAVCSAQDPTTVSLAQGRLSDLVVYNIQQDASTCVSVGARCMASFQNRLWVGAGQNLYWSEINAPASFSLTSNFITPEPGAGGDLTAILPARGDSAQLYLFAPSAVFLFEPRWGASSAHIPTAGDQLDVISSQLRTLTRDIGCIATQSLQWVVGAEGSDAFFLAADGIRALSRAADDQQAGAGFPVSWNIPTWIDRINFTHAHKAVASVFDNAYHLAVPLDGAIENTHILRYDFRFNAWSLLTWAPKAVISSQLGEDLRLFMQYNSQTTDTSTTAAAADAVYQVFEGYRNNLDPAAGRIHWREDSRVFMFDSPRLRKHWENLTLNLSSAETSTFLVQYRVNFGPWADLASDTLPGSADSIVLGETPLPWTYGEDTIRRRNFNLLDVPAADFIQFRIASGTAASDVGQIKVYEMDVYAHQDSLKFEDYA